MPTKCAFKCDTYEDNADKSPVVCQFKGTDGYVCGRPAGRGKCEDPAAVFCINGDGRPTPAPAKQPQLVDVIAKSPELSNFYTLLKKSHLDFTFKSPTAFTVFAPTDTAFAKLGKETIEKISSNQTMLALVLREHISISGAISSKSLVDGEKIATINSQGVTIIKGKTGWQVSNFAKTSVANIVKADVAGYAGNSQEASLMHEIDTVLLPDFNAASKIGQVCKPTDQKQCPKLPDNRCSKSCKTDTGDTCAPSTIATFGRTGACCDESCHIMRTKNGAGDRCFCSNDPRPGPTDQPTLPPTLSPCPATCAQPLEAKIDQGFTLTQVLSFAFRGGSVSPCGTTPCDATGLLNDAQTRETECKGNMVFACGDSCRPSCENPNPRNCISDPKQCTAGCYCPNNAPVWDDAEGMCIPDSKCPASDECESTIATDFLDSGNRQEDCSQHNLAGQYCKTTCQNNGCVPAQRFEGNDKLIRYCATLTQSNCGQDKSAGYCQYASGGTGPVFSCGPSDNGALGWSVTSPGSCSTGGGAIDEACETLIETDCLEQGECDLSAGSADQKCFALVGQALDECASQCAFGKGTDDPECADCLTQALLASNTIDPNEADIIACCGCVDDVFKAKNYNGFSVDDLNRLLVEPCKEQN